jgi:hypothetical protein
MTHIPKFPLHMYPPEGQAPFKKFKLDSTGRELEPNFVRGGRVTVMNDAEELELYLEGWSVSAAKSLSGDDLKKIARRIDAALPTSPITDLRKAARDSELRHHLAGAPKPLNAF